MTSESLRSVFGAYEQTLATGLLDVTGETALRLLLASLVRRALQVAPPEAVRLIGRDPHADRALRASYVTAFRELAPRVFGTALDDRLQPILRSLEDGIVPA